MRPFVTGTRIATSRPRAVTTTSSPPRAIPTYLLSRPSFPNADRDHRPPIPVPCACTGNYGDHIMHECGHFNGKATG